MTKNNNSKIEQLSIKLGWDYIERPQDNTIWKKGKPEVNFEFIDQLKNNTSRLVVNMSIEHWGGNSSQCIHDTYKILDKNFKDFIVLTHDVNDHQHFSNLFFYPFWYHKTAENFQKLATDNLPKKFKISCLHGRPRFHRIANYLQLVDKSYHSDIYKKISVEDVFFTRPDDYLLPDEIIARWNEYSTNIPYHKIINRKQIWELKENDALDAYANSYINLVVETSILPELFVTEKTWKAVASGQLFLIFGNPNTIDYLRKVGVDTFDDIIDHDYYDRETDWLERLNKLHKVLDRLVEQDLKSLWANTYDRRVANQSKFSNLEFDSGYEQTLINRLL